MRQVIVHSNDALTGCSAIDGWSTDSKLVAFRVSKTGTYSINVVPNNQNSTGFSIFSLSTTFNCSTFLGSNAFVTQTGASWYLNKTITLNACTTYYVVVYNFFSSTDFTINFSGSGDVIEVLPDIGGFSYTYVAVNQSNNQIVSVSATSDFTSLAGGTFQVYGLSYANGFDTNSLLNKTIEQAYALGTCMLFSNNSKQLTVIPSPCPTNLSLVNPTDNITTGNITKQASSTNGKITATNFVTGSGTKATYQAKAIELNAGFKAETGTIFRAETGGCN